MNDALKQVDQEGTPTAQQSGTRESWTAAQRLERLETKIRLWWRRRTYSYEERRTDRGTRMEKRRAAVKTTAQAARTAGKQSGAKGKQATVYAAAAPQAKVRRTVERTKPDSAAALWQSIVRECERMKRRWRHIRREQKAHRVPESNRLPIQLVLMLGGLLPMLGSKMRELLVGRHRKSVHRSGGIRARLENWRVRPVAFFGVVACVAVVVLFFSFNTFGTTVTYKGEVVAKVSSKMAAENAVRNLENVTSSALGGNYTISSSLLQYSSGLMPRKDVVDGETFEEELSEDIGLVTYAYSLYVDGEMIGATPYEGALDELLKQLQASVTDENTISCGFQENVEIKVGYVPTEKIMNLGYLAETLFSTKTEEVTYTVKSGDTWSEIAEDHGMTSAELLEMNPGYNINKLQIGEVLTLSAAVPYLTMTVVRQERYVEDVMYDIEYTDTNTLYKGDYKVTSAGEYGAADVVANVTYVNGEETERTILSSVTLKEPVTEQRLQGTKERPTWYPTGTFRWPVSGRITSYFGGRKSPGGIGSTNHRGIDIAAPKGTPVYAADGGTVTYAGWMSGYGYLVRIDHGNGYETYYGHNSSLLVSAGQHVYKGQQIARVGSTGNSTGNHCHFEIRYNGVAKNPLNYL